MTDSVYTAQDKVCVNCKHMVVSKNWWTKLGHLFGKNYNYYLCLTPDRIHSAMNNITGKIIITNKPVRCVDDRSYNGRCDQNGIRWEPNRTWREKKENLFKQLKAEEKS